tara:strand:+ start:200 stop:637 length:438 start_codon:yes stop_codon:yes gene_type:complete
MAQEQVGSGQQRFVVGAITTRLTVTVPGSIVGGDLVRVAAPDGSYHSVVVPAGLSAGQQFSVELLAGNSSEGGGAAEVAKLRVRGVPPTPCHARGGCPSEPRCPRQVELEAERHLRRDLQQEAIRFRQVRRPPTPHPSIHHEPHE